MFKACAPPLVGVNMAAAIIFVATTTFKPTVAATIFVIVAATTFKPTSVAIVVVETVFGTEVDGTIATAAVMLTCGRNKL